MKKLILGFVLLLSLSGCIQDNKHELKQEIKNEIIEEYDLDKDDINSQMIQTTSFIKSVTVALQVTIGEVTSLGSGILIYGESNTYQVLTNEHVIRYADQIEIFIPSENLYIEAETVKESRELDLAILEFTTLKSLETYDLKLVEFSVGEFILSIGTPTDIEYANSISFGIISRIEDDIIQHDASINVGNSGGPIFNLNGDLLGINVSKINTSIVGGNIIQVDGIGFSIPISTIMSFVNESTN